MDTPNKVTRPIGPQEIVAQLCDAYFLLLCSAGQTTELDRRSYVPLAPSDSNRGPAQEITGMFLRWYLTDEHDGLVSRAQNMSVRLELGGLATYLSSQAPPYTPDKLEECITNLKKTEQDTSIPDGWGVKQPDAPVITQAILLCDALQGKSGLQESVVWAQNRDPVLNKLRKLVGYLEAISQAE